MKKIIICLFAAGIFLGCSEPAEERVENVIFMIGDGMGLTHITALSMTQQYEPLNMERATHIGLQKTYSANNRVTDSAAAATALACGVKTNNSVIGLDPEGNRLESSLELAQKSGRATALVTTSQPTHATPAGFYAKSDYRRNYDNIISNLLTQGVDVIAGSNHKSLHKKGEDGSDLIIDEFKTQGYNYVTSPEEFYALDSPPAMLLAKKSKFPYAALDTLGLRTDYLARATEKTLELLGKTGKKGFFMLVEGSHIDYTSHDNDIKTTLGELREFDDAVGVAIDYAEKNPGTLVIITGDHETGGLAIISGDTDFTKSESGINYSWATTSHSGTFLPVFAYGTGAENFTGVMENAELGRRVKELMAK